MDKKRKKTAEDIEPANMVDIPEGDTTPDDIMGEGGGDFVGGGDMGGGDGMDFADELGEGGPAATTDTTNWDEVEIFPTGHLDRLIENQDDFEIDFSKLT